MTAACVEVPGWGCSPPSANRRSQGTSKAWDCSHQSIAVVTRRPIGGACRSRRCRWAALSTTQFDLSSSLLVPLGCERVAVDLEVVFARQQLFEGRVTLATELALHLQRHRHTEEREVDLDVERGPAGDLLGLVVIG